VARRHNGPPLPIAGKFQEDACFSMAQALRAYKPRTSSNQGVMMVSKSSPSR
jgi:hypothetical protein